MEDIVSITKTYSKDPYNFVDFTPKSNLTHKNSEDDFEKNIQKFFKEKKFILSDEYSHENTKVFLKDKAVAMEKIHLDDSLKEFPKKKIYYSLPHAKKKKISGIKKRGSIMSYLFAKESKDLIDLISGFH